MGASNRTLLAKLGFADADRKSPRHDLACNYIGLNSDVLQRVLQAAIPPTIAGVEVLKARGTIEHQVLKGDGKYSTTVGFVDVLASYILGIRCRFQDPDREWEQESFCAYVEKSAVIEVKISHCLVGDLIRQLRVYNEHVPPAPPKRIWGHCELSPKLASYMEEHRGVIALGDNRKYSLMETAEEGRQRLDEIRRLTVAVLDFDTDDEYRKSLRACGITPVRLGAGFEEFLRTRGDGDPEKGAPEI